jgi:pheganomycin biosynthesis PGM1-like protein
MTTHESTRPAPTLGLTPKEIAVRYAALQAKLVPLWKSIASLNRDPQTIVVVPSITLDSLNMPPAVLQAMEERFLFMLFLLRQPNARMIYVTSRPILPDVVDYYLGLLPGVIPAHARGRFFNPVPHDSTLRPLSLKLLERPRLLAQIRDLIPDKERAHLVPYNTTELERDLAIRLGIPMYGADPRHFELGTKSGCRKLFDRAGVSYPLGAEDLRTADDVLDALARLRAARPQVRSAMVKHNEGVSGAGNAVVNLSDLPAPGDKAERGVLLERLTGMKFESARQSYDLYMAKLAELAGIVEERVIGEEIRSPSVQLRITPLGQLEILSTHDQVLGGPSGQSYLGCRFPADPAYAVVITREAVKVGQELVGEGVLGRFAFDFVVVRNGGAWTPYAIELNLRKGGTTHPFLTLQFLTDGRYDPESATFTSPSGRSKCFVATDHLESELYRGLLPQDIFDIMVRHGLHFNQTRQTGVVLHMLTALSERGRLGLTAVGETQAEADEIYQRAVEVLDREAETAIRQDPLPPV